MSKPKYDSTVARITGNLLSGNHNASLQAVANAVETARAIVAEVKRTEPESAE